MADLFSFYASRVTSSNSVTVVSGVTGTRIINGINVANPSTSATASVSVQVLLGTNAFSFVPLQELGTQTRSQLMTSPISLQTSDDIQANIGAGSEPVDVIVSVLERTG
jgi:hypothetical protein